MDDWREHGEFLRRLAGRLVSDRHAADDLVQDAHLAGLSGGPEQPQARRRWFARVVRNLSLNLRRGRHRRGERERAAARPEAVDPEDVRARLEVQARIVALVGELDEPYRTTVYLRFYQDLPPREIAVRQRVPVATVKTRLQRALSQLRARLDREFTRRSGWCAALLPLASVSRPLVPITPVLLGGAAVKTAVVVGLAAIAVALGVLYLPSDAEPASPPAQTSRLDREREAVAVVSTPVPVQTLREHLASEPEIGTEPTGDWIVMGRVVDTAGAPVAFASIAAEVDPSRQGVTTLAGEDGRYRLAVDLPEGISTWASVALDAEASAEGFASQQLREANLRREDRPRELVLDFTLSPGRFARGVIVDAQGAAAGGAKVALLDTEGKIRSSGGTGADGEYTLALGGGGPLWLAAGSAVGGSVLTGPHAVAEGSDLDLGTTALQGHAVLEGTLTHPDGGPVADFLVKARLLAADAGVGILLDQWLARDEEARLPRAFAGSAAGSTHTDARGYFRLDGLAPGTYELELPQLGRTEPYLLKGGPYHTGERVRVIVEAYKVHVRVVDQRGLAVPGAALMVFKEKSGQVTFSRGLDADGLFEVSPGSWTVTASLEGARPAVQPVQVIEGQHKYEVDLVLDFEPETGELQVLVTDDRGRELEAFEVDLWFQNPQDRREIVMPDFSFLEPEENGVLPPIPTGNYKVRVRFPDQPGRTMEPGRPERLGDHFPVDSFASIVRGERTTLRVNARRGGHLRLWIGPESGVRVALTLKDLASGATRKVSTLVEGTATGGRILRVAFLGVSGFSDLIPPGTYMLRATAEGYADFERTVVIEPGGVTELRIDMRPK